MLYDFLIEFAGAFFGFLFAILIDGINDRIQTKNRTKIIAIGILDELEDINSSIKEYFEKQIVLRHRIATPTWDSLQYSGEVVHYLLNKEYYYDLLTVYSTIKRYNEEKDSMNHDEIYSDLCEIVGVSDRIIIKIREGR